MLQLFLSLVIFFFPLLSEAAQKICLNMIVKNESRVIKRCLDSVIPIVDYWVIVDTGSTDGTQEIIKKHLKDIPGQLYERSWKNWGESRSEALELARGKCDYILFMDADDTLEFEEGHKLPNLTEDIYNMWRGTSDFSYLKPQLVKTEVPLRWVGVTHEYLDCGSTYTSAVLSGVRYVTRDGGACSYDPQKFWKNVKLLEEGLKKEPENNRYVFYLAESYRDAGEKGKALECFQRRVKMGGWDEEVFWSKLQIAHLLKRMDFSSSIVIDSFLQAHRFRPHRAEPIYYLAEIYNQERNHSKAYEYLKIRDFIQKPKEKDVLFNEDWIERYGLLFQLSICSFFVGNYEESLKICDQLLAMDDLPESWRKQTEVNRTYPLEKLKVKKK